MTLPRNYDTWRLRGPEEPDEPKKVECYNCCGGGCDDCNGTGEVEADAEEYENERGEWLRDRRDGL